MSPTGSTVQYYSDDGHIMAAVVTEDFSSEMKNLKVILDGVNSRQHGFSEEECAAGFVWRTSVHRGEGPKHWRPLPRDGT